MIKSSHYRILKNPQEVVRLAELVRQNADSSRAELGFLPSATYAEAATKGRLWVVMSRDGLSAECAGHLLFGGRFPHMRVFQLYVAPKHRRNGLALTLIEELVSEAESFSYLTVSARVADGLIANDFWQRAGFESVSLVRGGKSRKQWIRLRCRKLNTPTLFDILTASSTPSPADLRLPERLYHKTPIYSFDLNVLFDLIRNRDGGAQVRKILTGAMSGSVWLSVAPEFIDELARTTIPGKRDPVLEFASTLPRFPRPPAEVIKHLSLELAPLVFPERARTNRLTARDESDLAHLATAIHHRAAGFISSEKAILRCSQVLRDRYELDVVGVRELAEMVTSPDWSEGDQVSIGAGNEVEIRWKELQESDRPAAETFLAGLKLDREVIANALAPGHSGAFRRRLWSIDSSSQVVAYASWDAPRRLSPRLNAYFMVDDRSTGAEAAVEQAFFLLLQDAGRMGPCLVTVVVASAANARHIALSHGFRLATSEGGARTTTLQKVCIGGIVTSDKWGEVRERVRRVAGITLPSLPPLYAGPQMGIGLTACSGTQLEIPLKDLESLLSPALLALPGRPGVIVPIQGHYAAQLLGTSAQGQLFPKYEASLLNDRVYYSSVRALNVLVPGCVLLFYESGKGGGRGAIVATARALANATCTPKEISLETKRRGVLEDQPITSIARRGKTGITWLDSVMHLPHPIPFARLKALGLVDGTNLVTARAIDHDAVRQLVREGFPGGY